MLSAFQFSTEMLFNKSDNLHVVTALDVDGFHQYTSSFLKGNSAFLDLHGAWAGMLMLKFNIQYRTPSNVLLTECKENYIYK